MKRWAWGAALAALVGCKEPPPKVAPTPPAAPAAAAPAAATPVAKERRGPPPAALQAWCGKCHKLPPPSALARSVWPAEVEEMQRIAEEVGVKLEGMSARDVALWYALSAPERHTLFLGPKAPTEGPVPFVRRERSAAARKKLPTVSNVRLVHLTQADRPQVLVTEMGAGRVLLFDPAKPAEGFKEIGQAKHPGRARVVDLDGDGVRDVLLSDLGIFYPSNDKEGAVYWLRGRPGGGFKRKTLAQGLGRVADAEAADLDGDGDLDVAVAVFGWRNVGRVLLLERQGRSVTPHTVVERTGALHATPRDLDGDGRMDLVVLFAQEHERVSAFMNKGGFKFEEIVLHEAPHPAWGYSGMQMTDLDGDGDLDVLLTNGDTLDLSGDEERGKAGPEHLLMPYHGVSWLENAGELRFTHHPIAPLYGAHRAQAADLDGDGDLDVVASSYMPLAPEATVTGPYRTESLIWLERRSASEWTRHTLSTRDVEIPTLDLGDLDGDGDVDIVTGHLFLDRLRSDQRDVSLTLWESRLKPAASQQPTVP